MGRTAPPAAAWLPLVMAGLLPLPLAAAPDHSGPWAPFVEPDFPFFSSVVDARTAGAPSPTNNLTPRGIVLRAGNEAWVAFDVDLLRVAAVWQGRDPVTPVSMSQGSYHSAGTKAPDGQNRLPVPAGTLWLASAPQPGWSVGETPQRDDPRPTGPDPREIGRGPLPPAQGRFEAIQMEPDTARLEYVAGGGTVIETSRFVPETGHFERHLRLGPCRQTRWLMAGRTAANRDLVLDPARTGISGATLRRDPDGTVMVRIPPLEHSGDLVLRLGPAGGAEQRPDAAPAASPRPTTPRWPGSVVTPPVAGTNGAAVIVDHFPVPLTNPWRRNVRVADLGFFPDGRAAAVTFDGDVWIIDDLQEGTSGARWRRFASGLHEPMGVVIRDQTAVVHDRNGIWRLRDTDGDGEADRHELISIAFGQTAETREFATGLRSAPDGSYIISKGGQQSTTLGRHNGSVLRVPADGSPAEVLGWGLRMPFIGVHPRTGLVTASDQQGHYIPSTPLHIIQDRRFYGFISLILPKEKYPAPIATPLTWIPHPVNASGVSQVWLTDARMGPLNDAMIHLGYYRPEVFVVKLDDAGGQPQAAVMSLTRDLRFPPLNGVVNPRDGRLYVTGFQIWGTEAPWISGIARLRPGGEAGYLPRMIRACTEGVLIRFDLPVDAASAINPANYSLEGWNYRRTANYGSPHYRSDGTKGQDTFRPSSAYLSRDGRTVFVGVPGLRPLDQLRVGWSLRDGTGRTFAQNAYFTPHDLPLFSPTAEGFADFKVDLSPRAGGTRELSPNTAVEGRRLAELMGCVACHSTDGSTLGKVGPTWKGLAGRERRFADGTSTRADAAYLRESIREPAARVVAGFDKTDTGMPSYEGVLTDDQIEALVTYLQTIR